MSRAAVLIGVDRSGNLPVLGDAAAGALKMEQWARSQGMENVQPLTDDGGGVVTVSDVKKAIRDIVDAGTTEQLVVYFAGHGVNIQRNEYWLLSDAPRDSQAAVNVSASVELALYCGIPYVVLISDACRTAAEGIQAQGVRGSEIFPNDDFTGLQNPVDLFYSCMLGRPAHEINDATTAAREYKALYTQELLRGLGGEWPDLLQLEVDGRKEIGYVRPRPLKSFLHQEVGRRIAALKLTTKVIQEPDAHIASPPNAWISRVGPRVRGFPKPQPIEQDTRVISGLAPDTPGAISRSLLEPALAGDLDMLTISLSKIRAADHPLAGSLAQSTQRRLESFGVSHHETECGFKVRGAKLIEAFSLKAKAELLPSGDDVRVGVQPPGASVLLVFENGTGVTLPAIPGFIGGLTVESGEVVDVAYEPSQNSWRWPGFVERAPAIRALRAVASSFTRDGIFRLDGPDALSVARSMQVQKGVDPTLAIYAAYAYRDLQRLDLIREMSAYMQDDLGARLFDLGLLAHELDGKQAGVDLSVLSFTPLLSQGWALLEVLRVSLPPSLDGIQGTLLSSVWTMFSPQGVNNIRRALLQGLN